MADQQLTIKPIKSAGFFLKKQKLMNFCLFPFTHSSHPLLHKSIITTEAVVDLFVGAPTVVFFHHPSLFSLFLPSHILCVYFLMLFKVAFNFFSFFDKCFPFLVVLINLILNLLEAKWLGCL
jgi:hypothetical protein